MTKKAVITGITGQDGAYLATLLLLKGYEVYGVQRRSAVGHTPNIDHIIEDPNLLLCYGDVMDSSMLMRLIGDVKPDEVYNLAAQSHVGVSFQIPEYTANIDGLGALRILEAIRSLGLKDKTRFYQASTSELYGNPIETPQTEQTPFHPVSPYGVAKLFAYWTTVNYREAHGMYACNGILFNHESMLRGKEFVSQKIVKGLVGIKMGTQDCLYLGNLRAMRDWGHAADYVKSMWMMLQQDRPGDFVIATGKQYSVKEFVDKAARQLGIRLKWVRWLGESVLEEGYDLDTGNTIIRVDASLFRPSEVYSLRGDATKAKQVLGWEPTFDLDGVIHDMLGAEIERNSIGENQWQQLTTL